MVPGPEDHDCGWKQRALELEDKLSAVVGQLEALNRQVFGKKSEKMPPMDREVRKKRPPDPAVTQERRRKNAELRATRVVTNDSSTRFPLTSGAARIVRTRNSSRLARARSRSSGTMSGVFPSAAPCA